MATQAFTLPAEAWPGLREELQLHHGPALADGQPTWTLHDPVRHKFVRIDWITYEVLRRWWLADAGLIASQVNAQTALHIDTSHVVQVLLFARQHGLIKAAGISDRTGSGSMRAGLTWLLHHYLFFRVPLVNPDRWLRRLLPWVQGLGGVWFQRATLIALLTGAVFALRDWTAVRNQVVDLLSWRGLLLYAVTLVSVKIAHEFGHAFVARRHGCRVPTMGVAFMVLWPIAYTDTSEVWRLADGRARLMVALAGVRTELTIAAWSLLAWAWLPDGPLRTAAFLLATTTWITTVMINLSPFMRFDGYFVLCDLLDEPNLHERSFALARWWMRKQLLGWDAEPPEALPAGQRRLWIAFAFITWAYRLALYLGIAWLVYQFAIKAVGLLLLVVEIGWFIVLPVARELQIWRVGRKAWWGSPRARLWRWLGPALLLVGFIPLPSFEGAGAVLQPTQHLAVRLPAAAQVNTVHVQSGQQVEAGTTLLDATAPQLQQRLEATQARIRQLQSQVAGAGVDPAQQSQWGSLQEQLSTARDEEIAIREELDRYRPRAPFAGQIVEMEPSLRAGLIATGQYPVMWLASAAEWRVVAYASESAVRAVKAGDEVRFVADARPWIGLAARVVSVSPHQALVLGEPMLAQVHGGAIATVQQGHQLLPRDPVYRVELTIEEDPGLAPRQWRGHVRLAHPWTSLWQRAWTATASVLTRELGF